MHTDSRLVPVARHREHAFAIARHAAIRLRGDLPGVTSAVVVAALADDGVVVELAVRCDPDDAIAAVIDLLRVNHRDHDFPAWGYFVASLLPDAWLAGEGRALGVALPRTPGLDRLDAAAHDLGVEVLDWLAVAGDRGASLFEALGRGWRWIDREDSPSHEGGAG